MNKGNKILLGILAFVVVCVVGYALFGETITVTGSATASGEWSITTTCVSGLSQDIKNFMLQYRKKKYVLLHLKQQFRNTAKRKDVCIEQFVFSKEHISSHRHQPASFHSACACCCLCIKNKS